MQPSDFIHPEDAAALRQMESLPGFAALIKKVLSIGYETLQYGVNMASSIRLSDKHHPIKGTGIGVLTLELAYLYVRFNQRSRKRS